MCKMEELTVKKKVWVTRYESSSLYDEYLLTYVSVERVKRNLYQFKLIKIDKVNNKPFTGGGGYIIHNLPKIGEKKLLRKHSIKWNVKNYTWAGRIVHWFNVKWPCKDENYIQHPTELYPIMYRSYHGLTYPKTYENKH